MGSSDTCTVACDLPVPLREQYRRTGLDIPPRVWDTRSPCVWYRSFELIDRMHMSQNGSRIRAVRVYLGRFPAAVFDFIRQLLRNIIYDRYFLFSYMLPQKRERQKTHNFHAAS